MSSTTPSPLKPLSVKHLFVLMILPWLWTWLGFYGADQFLAALFFYHVCACLLPCLIINRPRPRIIPESSRFWLPTILMILFLNAVMLGGFEIMRPWFFLPEHFASEMARIHFRPSLLPAFAFSFVLVNPLIEELFWRGLIFEQWRKHLPLVQAVLLSSLFFGMWHWIIVEPFFSPVGTLLVVSGVAIGGIIFSGFYHRYQALLPAVLVHGLGCDLPIIIILWRMYLHTQWQTALLQG